MEHKNGLDDRSRRTPKYSRKADKIIQLVVKIDKIHKENCGKMTIDELKLRIEVRINLELWSAQNTLKNLLKHIHRFFKWIHK